MGGALEQKCLSQGGIIREHDVNAMLKRKVAKTVIIKGVLFAQ